MFCFKCLDKEFTRISKSKTLDHTIEKADWEYLTVLTMFFCAFRFSLKKYSDNKNWLNNVFKIFGASKGYSLNLKTSFADKLRYFYFIKLI